MAAAVSEINLGVTEPVGTWLDYRKLGRRLASLTPEQVATDQRRRAFAALPEALAEHGYNGAVVADVLRCAHISRKTFYALFGSKGDALRACRDDAFEVLRHDLAGLLPILDPRPDALADALGVPLGFAAQDPDRARLLLADPWLAGPLAGEGWEAVLSFVSLLLQGRRRARVSIRREGLLGGARYVVLSRIHAGRADTLPALARPLAELILATGPGRS